MYPERSRHAHVYNRRHYDTAEQRENPAALTWRRVLRELAKYCTFSYGTVPLSVQRIVVIVLRPLFDP